MSAALLLTTTPLPPIDPRHYSQLLVREATDLEAKYKDILAGQSISIGRYVGTRYLGIYYVHGIGNVHSNTFSYKLAMCPIFWGQVWEDIFNSSH